MICQTALCIDKLLCDEYTDTGKYLQKHIKSMSHKVPVTLINKETVKLFCNT